MKYIFEIEFGGLGDHLFYSPLPRLLKEFKIADRVFISNASKVRNQETLDLVWKDNPYLDGFTDEEPTKFNRATTNIQKVINLEMAKHGIILNNEINPEIYGKIYSKPEYVGKNYIDLNYISYAGAITPWDEYNILSQYKNYILVNPKKHLPFMKKSEIVYTKSLSDYASLIKSSSHFIALTSGGASLAAALGKKCTVFYGYGHDPINRHTCNTNIQIGGNGVIRKWISEYLFKKNMKRISMSEYK